MGHAYRHGGAGAMPTVVGIQGAVITAVVQAPRGIRTVVEALRAIPAGFEAPVVRLTVVKVLRLMPTAVQAPGTMPMVVVVLASSSSLMKGCEKNPDCPVACADKVSATQTETV